MTETQDDNWSVEFNFDIPEDYRRSFYLRDGDLALVIEVKGKNCFFKSIGGVGDSPLGMHLDWIQDCMEVVRREFGQ